MSRKPRIPLPKGWPARVKLAIRHIIALAQYATAQTRVWAATGQWSPDTYDYLVPS